MAKEDEKVSENIEETADNTLASTENVAKETLDTRESELNVFADQLKEKEAELDKREEDNAKREAELDKREKEISKREAELDKREKSLTKKEPKPAEPKAEAVSFEFNGEKYRFTDDAPSKIRIDGIVKTQQEISQDEDILLQLVVGGSGLIEKV